MLHACIHVFRKGSMLCEQETEAKFIKSLCRTEFQTLIIGLFLYLSANFHVYI